MGREDVLDVARLILSQCAGPFVKDKKGYDRFDAFTVREILLPDIFGISELSDSEIEYIRQKLLRYKKQIRKIGLANDYSNKQIENALLKLDQPVSEGSLIIHGKLENGVYGRISFKWIKENFPHFVKNEKEK